MYGWSDFGENEKKREKMGGKGVWLRGEGEENWWNWLFFLWVYQNLISPNWEKMRMKMKSKKSWAFWTKLPNHFDQFFVHFLFAFSQSKRSIF